MCTCIWFLIPEIHTHTNNYTHIDTDITNTKHTVICLPSFLSKSNSRSAPYNQVWEPERRNKCRDAPSTACSVPPTLWPSETLSPHYFLSLHLWNKMVRFDGMAAYNNLSSTLINTQDLKLLWVQSAKCKTDNSYFHPPPPQPKSGWSSLRGLLHKCQPRSTEVGPDLWL